MNSTKRILISCFVCFIFAGIFPFIPAFAGTGDSVKTLHDLTDDILGCENQQGETEATVSISAEDPKAGTVKIHFDPPLQFNSQVSDWTGGIISIDVKGNIFTIKSDVRAICSGSGSNLLIKGDCFNDRPGHFSIQQLTGASTTIPFVIVYNYNAGDMLCTDGGGLVSSPPSGGCVTGTGNKDKLTGTFGDDCIDGKGGNDKITGLDGDDELKGGDGKDSLDGGEDNDELTGGPGADKFECGDGNDEITDFNPSEDQKNPDDCEQFE